MTTQKVVDGLGWSLECKSILDPQWLKEFDFVHPAVPGKGSQCGAKCSGQCMDWIGLSSVLRLLQQYSIGYMEGGFYRSKDPTNSIKVLKEKAAKENNTKKHKENRKYTHTKNSIQITVTQINTASPLVYNNMGWLGDISQEGRLTRPEWWWDCRSGTPSRTRLSAEWHNNMAGSREGLFGVVIADSCIKPRKLHSGDHHAVLASRSSCLSCVETRSDIVYKSSELHCLRWTDTQMD